MKKRKSLKNIHRRCDWVITLDRNAGVEYFDSPRDNRDVYDTYVIDCVPERDDLGCLQLVTSTGNLEEMHDILARSLGDMGLDHSARNTEFLMQSLKALSGRLVIRLTGNRQAQISEIVSLAFSHAYCKNAVKDDDLLPLDQGFLHPRRRYPGYLAALASIRREDQGLSSGSDLYIGDAASGASFSIHRGEISRESI